MLILALASAYGSVQTDPTLSAMCHPCCAALLKILLGGRRLCTGYTGHKPGGTWAARHLLNAIMRACCVAIISVPCIYDLSMCFISDVVLVPMLTVSTDAAGPDCRRKDQLGERACPVHRP